MLGWEAKMQIQELLALISLGEEVCSAVTRAKSFKVECGKVGKLVSRLLQMLKTLFCVISSAHTSLYLRPVNCIVAKVKDDFELAQAIVYKCKRRNLLCRLFTSCNAIQFRELFNSLDVSISDMEWLLTIYEPQSRAIGSTDYKNDTFLVWSCIATIKMERELRDRVQAVERLALLAQQKDDCKNIIFKEGGVPPLQKFLKENISLDAQITAANTLCLLADKPERKAIIMKEMISTILNRLSRTSPIRDQIQAANLVAGIVEHNQKLKEYDLIRENVIWRLLTLLSTDSCTDDPRTNSLKLKLKLSCSKALWMLAQGSPSNCRTFTETKGMLCFAKLVETEQDELQYNCLMIIREITDIAESNKDFRHSAFKRTSPAAKAVVDVLLRVIKEFDDTKLRIPAIKSVGSLARSFSAKECPVIGPLVARLGDTNQEVAMEASIALQKFVCTNNHLCSEHSKSIIESNGVPLLMKLLDGDKKLQPHGLALICYLANHDCSGKALINAGALTALQTTGLTIAAEHPELKEFVSNAISKLQSNHADKQEQLNTSPGIKQFITEQSKAVFNFVERHLKLLSEGLTVYLPRLVNLRLQEGDWKSSPIVRRCKKRISRALRCLKTKRIQPFLKAKCEQLALTVRSVMKYLGKRLVVMKEIARKLRLVKKLVKSIVKKEIRRKFGYIIHKRCKIVIWT